MTTGRVLVLIQVGSLRSPSQAHALSKTEPPKLGKSKADGCGFRAEPLAKSPHKPSAIFFRF